MLRSVNYLLRYCIDSGLSLSFAHTHKLTIPPARCIMFARLFPIIKINDLNRLTIKQLY